MLGQCASLAHLDLGLSIQGSKLGLARAYHDSPSLKVGRRRYTRVCKVRVAQCVCIALTGSKSQTSRKQTPFSALGCGRLRHLVRFVSMYD